MRARPSARPHRVRHSWSLRRKPPPSASPEAELDGSGGLGESASPEGDADDEALDDALDDGLDDGDEEGDSLFDGDEDGLDDGDSEVSLELGDGGGLTAAPMSVSRSNFEAFWPFSADWVYAAQILAGKSPPLTRPPPAVPLSETCFFSPSPNIPTEVTRSGV